MMRGIDVLLHARRKIGTDDFGAPVYADSAETVHNVLVGEPAEGDIVNDTQLYGKRLAYTLAIPKGDAHEWSDCQVEFFGQEFRVYGPVTEGIEPMLPLPWNKKVKVERIE